MWKWIKIWGIICVGAVPVYGQADSINVRMQHIKIAAEDSMKLQYAAGIPAFLEKIPYGTYSELPQVQYLGYKKCINADVELFSWVVPLKKGQQCYNWFRFKEGRPPVLQVGEWLCYDLLAFRSEGEEYFVLFNWAKTSRTNRKMLQIAQVEDNGSFSFQHPLMRKGNSRSASLSFEYALEGSMMLKQDKKGKRIIFDHLAPVDKKYEGYFMFYGPDASCDALILKKGEWWYTDNVKP